MKTHNSIFALVFLVISTMFLSGCMFGGGAMTLFNPHTGTEGMKVTVLRNAPRLQEYDQSEVMIGLKIQNLGAASIKNGIIVLGSDNPYTKSFDKKEIRVDLMGKEETFAIRGETKIDFFSGQLQPLADYQTLHTSTVSVKSCYAYYTLAQADICVDTDIYELLESRKACSVSDITLSNQGAPVAITKIENEIIPAKGEKVQVGIRIYFENLGAGKVVSASSYQTFCSRDATPSENDFGIMQISAEMGGQEMECKGNAEILMDEAGSISCFSEPVDIIPPYKTSLVIRLDYGYIDVQKVSFDIVPLP